MSKKIKWKFWQQSTSKAWFFVVILIGMIVLLLLLSVLFKKEITVKSELDQLLENIPDKAYITTAKVLSDNPKYQNGVFVKRELKEYISSFTVKNYNEAATKIIGFQDKINGFDLNTALEIDQVLAESLTLAAMKVKRSKQNIPSEQHSCSNFNGLLNPSLMVMDLTLWTGKSRIYTTLQEHKDVGKLCLFYYPQLSHGMFTYDPITARIVQRSVFCNPSESKSKCFGVWDYFWKYGLGPVNYGVGCTLTDWMNQGFICVNGIDLRNSSEDRIVRARFEYGLERPFLIVVTVDVKEEFQNALGANGKSIIDNVRQKCTKIKEKTSKYGNLPPALSAGSSLTGSAVSTKMYSSEDVGDELNEEYEKAMLFASLFSEACLLNPQEFAKDLAGGGGAGQFGLNKPNACVLSAAQQIATESAGETRQCLSNFAHQQQSSRLNEIMTADGIPDNRCKPSAGTGPCTSTYCLSGVGKDCGSNGRGCGREPTEQEPTWLNAKRNKEGDYERKSGMNVRIAGDKEINDICGKGYAHECYDKKSDTAYIAESDVKPQGMPTTMLSPNKNQEYYTTAGIMKHAEGHRRYDDPTRSEKENEEAQKERDSKDSKNFVKPKDKKSTPTPDDVGGSGEPGDCSSQAERMLQQWEGLTNCFEKTEREPRNSGDLPPGKPQPDPAPPGDEVGGSVVPTCDETNENGGGSGYFGTMQGYLDQCLIGDFCEYSGAFYGVGLPSDTRCLMVQGVEGCPPLN